MQWEAAPLFATPVFKFSLPDTEAITAYFHEHIHEKSGNERDAQGALSHYYSRHNVFKTFPELTDFGKTLEEAGSFTYKELLNYQDSGDMKITNAWFNLCQPGGSQPAHSHANCRLSGTLYLQTDEHSALDFYHPISSPAMHTELYDKPSENNNKHGLKFHNQQARIRVKNGDCLFWPSHLRHGYQNNRTPNRLTLSFNLMPKFLNLDYKLSLGDFD